MWYAHLYGLCHQGQKCTTEDMGWPYITPEDMESSSRKPNVTLEDNYERVSSEWEVDAKRTNFKEASAAIMRQIKDVKFSH